MDKQQPGRGLYFDEFYVGRRFITARRTITEEDIQAFANLTGDDDPIHTDAVYAAGHPFGQRVAHGLLGLSIAEGLAVQLGIIEGTLLAFREVLEWKFSAPIFIGDEVGAVFNVVETKAVPRLNGGLVTLFAEITNQDGRIVQHGKWSMLVMDRAHQG